MRDDSGPLAPGDHTELASDAGWSGGRSLARLALGPRCQTYESVAEATGHPGVDDAPYLAAALVTAAGLTDENQLATTPAAIAAHFALGSAEDAIYRWPACWSTRETARHGHNCSHAAQETWPQLPAYAVS
jgi:hypothetical protein